MSPIPPEDPVSVPVWVMQALVIPIAVGLVWALYKLGIREMARWQRQIEDMQDQQDRLERQLREMRGELHSDHGTVEGKLEKLLEEVQS